MGERVNPAEVMRMLSESLNRLGPVMDEGLEPLLQAVVDYARKLAHAVFAGIILLYSSDPTVIRYFKVSGWRARFSELPKGHGMYFLPVKTGGALRVESISRHPLSIGAPPGHPPVESLLTIPLQSHGKTVGCLFLGNPPNKGVFTQNDEAIVSGFAALCTTAIEWCEQRDSEQYRVAAEERKRVADELHDSLSQTLFAVAREIDHLERMLPTAEDKRELQTRIARLRDLTTQCQAELRAILFRFMNDETGPDSNALTRLVQEFQRITGLPTHLVTEGDFSRLSVPVRQTVLKVIEESLTNVYRHANSPAATVHVLVERDQAIVAVQDAGIGISEEALRFLTHPAGHFGLHSMARSVQRLNGSLEIFQNDDGGTTVRCTIPLTNEQDHKRDRRRTRPRSGVSGRVSGDGTVDGTVRGSVS